jgi:two-component system copper resistance phosphate regulon response regulator CusR
MRILLVEDDPRLAQTLARGLREHAYAVDVVGDGDAAVYQAAVTPYDAIVLDVMLPGRDGLAVCRELRRRGSTVKVLMLTARDTIADRVAGLDTGADDYLTKPFAMEELLARLRALLRRGTSLEATTLTVADLEVDTRARTVRRGGRAVPLTTKEYTLLEYLARNAGRVVGRAEIADHAWDDNYDPFSNLIEVYISRLRKKIDAEGTPLLHTRRGAGYLLGVVADGDDAAASADA